MKATAYDDVNRLLDALLARMQAALGDRLVGLYLFGSLVWGDFDHAISDIDLLAATASDVDADAFVRLRAMQGDFAREHRVWDNRLEIAYVSLRVLRSLKSAHGQIALVSPGEPFHFKETGIDWLLNGYGIREWGVTLFGPPPQTLIEPISKAEFIQAVRDQAEEWRDYIVHTRQSRPYQAHAILTLCRALYAIRQGEQVSKRQAATWAQREMPEWAGLIGRALRWRENSGDETLGAEAAYPDTVRFVHHIIDRCHAAYARSQP